MSARGMPSIASSVENPTSTKFCNTLAPLAKLLRRLSLCVVPSEEDVTSSFRGYLGEVVFIVLQEYVLGLVVI